ncbi:hypothetical protein BV20DRAFT_322538 [Pilatotrama ljubarskyi]|nr:hypothetical protein BV20DRAFT_322538 [Pilatotrama ljubarskyi]
MLDRPWHLTVVRTRGLLFVRPEKSWRPIVSLCVVDSGHEQPLPDVVLGCDGQNPNLKSVVPIHGVQPSTRLVIQVFHKSQTKKKHRKRTLVGSASLSLGEFLNRHPLPHDRPVEHDVRLSCPPPQRKSPTIGGKHQHSASLTLKLAVPHLSHPLEGSRPQSPLSDDHSDDGHVFSDGASSSKIQSETLVSAVTDEHIDELPWEQPPARERPGESTGLRRRRRVRGFRVDSDSDGNESESSGEEPWAPPTPPDDYFDHPYDTESEDVCGSADRGEFVEAVVSPSILPRHADQVSITSMQRSLSFAESVVDSFTPYHELREADEENDIEKAETVLGRLLTEWYVVGASLLALAAIDAAVFGFAPDALFVVDGFSQSVVAIGAIAAGIGLVSDAWYLILYSGANAAKFQRLAKDVYGSYFFFCLTCRLPVVCMFVSALALMLFLLGVAWTAWPTAVLVMSFVAGVLLTSQFLVYGIHRFINMLIWVVRVTWRRVAPRRESSQVHPQAHLHPVATPRPLPPAQPHGRLEMPIPEPAAV